MDVRSTAAVDDSSEADGTAWSMVAVTLAMVSRLCDAPGHSPNADEVGRSSRRQASTPRKVAGIAVAFGPTQWIDTYYRAGLSPASSGDPVSTGSFGDDGARAGSSGHGETITVSPGFNGPTCWRMSQDSHSPRQRSVASLRLQTLDTVAGDPAALHVLLDLTSPCPRSRLAQTGEVKGVGAEQFCAEAAEIQVGEVPRRSVVVVLRQDGVDVALVTETTDFSRIASTASCSARGKRPRRAGVPPERARRGGRHARGARVRWRYRARRQGMGRWRRFGGIARPRRQYSVRLLAFPKPTASLAELAGAQCRARGSHEDD